MRPENREDGMHVNQYRFVLALGVVSSIRAFATVAGADAFGSAGGLPNRTYVFQGKVAFATIPLSPASETVVVLTPQLPAVTYLVNVNVGTVIGPSDNVVCDTIPASAG